MEIVLNNYGTSLGRDNGGFVITNADGRHHVAVPDVKSIHISKGAQVSSDAVMLAVENEVEIIFVDKAGKPVGRVWSPKYGSISTIRKGQLAFCSSREAVEWIKDILSQKIENQEAMMLLMEGESHVETHSRLERGINKMEAIRGRVLSVGGESMAEVASTLRGYEGVASKVYFDVMNMFLPSRYRFEQRSQHPAMDVTNAMLNYGYGILYSKIEGMMIRTGIDPYLGVMHRDEYNRPVLVYDVIEKYRMWVDYVVFSIISQEIITDEYYSIRQDGSCWLEPLGRRIIIQSLNDYFDEIVPGDSLSRSRVTHLFLYIQDLAQKFKKTKI